jgi:hypothetical protein
MAVKLTPWERMERTLEFKEFDVVVLFRAVKKYG